MRDFIRSVVNDRGLYAIMILLNAPGWAAYSVVSYGLSLPPALTHSVFCIVAAVVIMTLDALYILACALHRVLSVIEYLMDR